MRAVIDDEGCNTIFARALCQYRYTRLEGRVCEAVICVHAHNTGSFLSNDFRNCVCFYLPGLDCAKRTLDTVYAVGFAVVAFTRNNHTSDGSSLYCVETCFTKNRLYAVVKRCNAQDSGLAHHASFMAKPDGRPHRQLISAHIMYTNIRQVQFRCGGYWLNCTPISTGG